MASVEKRKDNLFGQKQTKLLMDLLVYVVLSVVGIIFIMPFAWMVANSFKDIRGIYQYPPTFIPEVWHFENYTEAWTLTHFDLGFLNSAIVAGAVVLGQLFTASLAGYAFARLRFPGRDKIFLLYISLMMVPFTVLLIPLICADARLRLDQHLASCYCALLIHALGHLYDAAIHGDHTARTGGRRPHRRLWLLPHLLADHIAADQAGFGDPRHLYLRQHLEQLPVALDRAGQA